MRYLIIGVLVLMLGGCGCLYFPEPQERPNSWDEPEEEAGLSLDIGGCIQLFKGDDE